MPLFIPSRSVRLEAAVREPRGRRPRAAAVLCHPHPAYGGTMDNRVIYRSAKAVMEAGLASLRFNFRGTGASTGSFEDGADEKDDVAAAIDWLQNKYPSLPLVLVGFSFGAWVGLEVGCRDSRIQALVGLGLPLNIYNFDFLIESHKPALIIVGTQDEFCAQERLASLARLLPPSSAVRWIEGADHFFQSDLEKVQGLMTDFFQQMDFERTAS